MKPRLGLLAALLLVISGCAKQPVAQAQPVTSTEPLFAAAKLPEQAPGPCDACGAITLVLLEDSGGGPVNSTYVDDLAAQLRETYGLQVQVAAPMPVPAATFNRRRRQYDGTQIVQQIQPSLPAPGRDGSAVIALMNDDLYVSWKPEWKWAFGARSTFEAGGGWSVISAHRMKGAPAARRMLVMLGKYIGGIACGFEERSDPSSIMYDKILSPADLDRMNAVACYSP